MSQTVLDMTQTILSALNSDSVNSISDTSESMQVARIIQNKYYDILGRGDLPEQQMLMQLTASGDSTKPVLMTVPSGVLRIDWIKYFDNNPADGVQVSQFGSFSHGLNVDIDQSIPWITTSTTSVAIGTGSKTFTVEAGLEISVDDGVLIQSSINNMFGTVTSYSSTTLVVDVTETTGSGTYTDWVLTNTTADSVPGYKYVTGLPIDQFLDMVNRFNPADSNVKAFTFTEGGNDFVFYYKNNVQPQYYTVIENTYVVFDSHDSVYDTTLQSSKSMFFGLKVTPFTLSDSFVPDMDDDKFPLLLNEAKALAFYEFKQMPHALANQEIKRQWSSIQKDKAVSNKPSSFDQIPNMGRVPRTGGYSSGGYGAYKWMRGGSGQ